MIRRTVHAHLWILALLVTPLTHAQNGALPPLIDRDLFFTDTDIANAQISPDGKYIAFLKPLKNTRNLWVKRSFDPIASAWPLTSETERPIKGFQWTRDSAHLCFVKDSDGKGNFNLYSAEPGPNPSTPRNLTGFKGMSVETIDSARPGPETVYLTIAESDHSWADLYTLNASTGEKTLVRRNTDRIERWIFDQQGNLRLATRFANNGDTEILRADPDAFTKVFSCTNREICSPWIFDSESKRVYIFTNVGEGVDKEGLALLNPSDGKLEWVASDPLKRADVSWAAWMNNELVQTNYDDGAIRSYFHNKEFETESRLIESKLPGKTIRITGGSSDNRLLLLTASSATEPGETWLFDSKTKTLTFQFRLRESLPRESLAAVKPIQYASSDGLEIPALLTLPKGVQAKNLPSIVILHGGPGEHYSLSYLAYAQFLANRGYAVLMPNFRGSSGYGKSYVHAGEGEWGGKMQDDIAWGVKYLISQGIADPKRVGLFGGGFGGYLTLASIAFTPDLYHAAVEIGGSGDLRSLLARLWVDWEPSRKLMYQAVADPTTPEGEKWLRDHSPFNFLGQIKTPLLVADGADDHLTDRTENERIVMSLREAGVPVEYLLPPDEGPGITQPVNFLALAMETEKFFATYLGGRFQTGGTPETTHRLSEALIDPKTLVAPEKTSLPRTVRDLRPGTVRYRARLVANGEEVIVQMSSTVKKESDGWSVTDSIDGTPRENTDTSFLAVGTLAVRKRSVTQEAIAVDLEFTGNKANGTLFRDGKETPILTDTGGEIFADAPSGPRVIACLPLAEGYTTNFRSFDTSGMKPQLLRLRVAGSDRVTVPAGKFDTWRVEISTVGGGNSGWTLWIDKQTNIPVKSTATADSITVTKEMLP